MDAGVAVSTGGGVADAVGTGVGIFTGFGVGVVVGGRPGTVVDVGVAVNTGVGDAANVGACRTTALGSGDGLAVVLVAMGVVWLGVKPGTAAEGGGVASRVGATLAEISAAGVTTGPLVGGASSTTANAGVRVVVRSASSTLPQAPATRAATTNVINIDEIGDLETQRSWDE